MDKCIDPNLPTFLKGRLLVDGEVVVNEVMGLAQKSRKPYLILKQILRKRLIGQLGVFELYACQVRF